MLGIKSVASFCKVLGKSRSEIDAIVQNTAKFVESYQIINGTKSRNVVSAVGALRECQTNLFRRLLLPKIIPAENSHGSIRGRSPKTNAQTHENARFVFKTDIAGFYPSIHYKRVYRLFVELGCSPDVARICTKLCTFDHQLATGLVTSPIIADRLLRQVDSRIRAACIGCGLRYSRYVDDITISGTFNLEKSGIEASVGNILREHGFNVNEVKNEFQSVSENCTVTGIRIRGGKKIDVSREYAGRLQSHLRFAHSLSCGIMTEGDCLTENQLRGKVNFVTWVNPGRTQEKRMLRTIDWFSHKKNAILFGRVATKRRLIKKAATAT